MNPNQFMHHNQILDFVRSSDTIPPNQNIFMLIWTVLDDLLTPSKWPFGSYQKVFQHHPYQHKKLFWFWWMVLEHLPTPSKQHFWCTNWFGFRIHSNLGFLNLSKIYSIETLFLGYSPPKNSKGPLTIRIHWQLITVQLG